MSKAIKHGELTKEQSVVVKLGHAISVIKEMTTAHIQEQILVVNQVLFKNKSESATCDIQESTDKNPDRSFIIYLADCL